MAQLAAGNLNRLVAIQTQSVSRDASTGAQVISWSDAAIVWSEVREYATPQALGGGDITTTARPTRVRTRWRSVDKAVSRLRIGTRILRIIDVAEIGNKEGLELSAQEWSHE